MKSEEKPFDWSYHYDEFVWTFCAPDDPRCRVRTLWDGSWCTMRPTYSLFDKNFDADNIPEDYQYTPEMERESVKFRKENRLDKY